MIKIIDFWDDLTDTSAKKEALIEGIDFVVADVSLESPRGKNIYEQNIIYRIKVSLEHFIQFRKQNHWLAGRYGH